MLSQGSWKALKLEPLVECCLRDEKVSSLSAVHLGVQKDAEMWRQVELIKGENVMSVGGGRVWVEEKSVEVRAGEIGWIRRSVEGFLPCSTIV